jgi:hypothetical protein
MANGTTTFSTTAIGAMTFGTTTISTTTFSITTFSIKTFSTTIDKYDNQTLCIRHAKWPMVQRHSVQQQSVQ